MRLYLMTAMTVATIACGGSSPTTPTPTSPSIQGQWNGTYRVVSCNENTLAAGACNGIGGGGPHTLTPSQSGSNFTGLLGVGVFAIPVSGSVDTAGTVTLAGTGPVSFATLTITSWRAVLTGATMTGTMSYSVVADGGVVLVTATTTLTR